MTGAASAGLFGKLPARGDFVRAGLPGGFVDPFDAWLQHVIAASRDRLGAAWLPAYLEAPVWRYLLPPGRCGAGGVLGVLLPSVDRVGRYFPLTLAAVMSPGAAAPADAAWLDAAEAAGRAALERDATPAQVLDLLPPPPAGAGGAAGWWSDGGPLVAAMRLQPAGLPDAAMFAVMLGSDAAEALA